MTDCRAAVITAHHKPLEVQRIPVPELEPGAILVKIETATLCGTDIHRWHGPLQPPDSLPFITGHEACGTIEAINGDRTDLVDQPLKAGDRIVWAYPYCGHCYWCTVALQPCICPHRQSWGHNRSDQYPYLLGGVSEYQYVPPECQIVQVPESVSSASAAAAACAYRTIMNGFEKLGSVRPHETVVIQGAGPLGIFATAVARESGANQVLVIGAPAGRLEVAMEMGADATLNLDDVADAADRRKWVRDHTSGRGADVVIQVANSLAVPEGITLLRQGGRYVSIGGGGQASIPVNSFPREMSFHTIQSGEPRHWLQAVEFLASRRSRYPFEKLISASYPMDGINEAMEAMAAYKVVKAAIYPHGKP